MDFREKKEMKKKNFKIKQFLGKKIKELIISG
jgi:hypothetical protein